MAADMKDQTKVKRREWIKDVIGGRSDRFGYQLVVAFYPEAIWSSFNSVLECYCVMPYYSIICLVSTYYLSTSQLELLIRNSIKYVMVSAFKKLKIKLEETSTYIIKCQIIWFTRYEQITEG